MSRYADDVQRYRGKPVPLHLPHGGGTRAAVVYGCRCEVCTAPATPSREGQARTAIERDRALRRRKKGKPVPANVKHGIYAYRVYGCRCELCVSARSTAGHRRQKAWTERAWGRYSEGKDDAGQPTTIRCWPPRGAGPDWQCPHPSHKEV